MKKISVIFFGTHNFAASMLEALCADERYAVVGAVTQPDKEVGRKKVLTPPPAKIFAESRGIPVYQPESLKGFDLPVSVDVGIVAQYGKLVPEAILEAPAHGCINVHTSLLPKYRGASPIQSAILNGDTETGVTIMMMDKGLDTGDILAQETCSIGPDDLYEDVEASLMNISGPLLCNTVTGYISGDIVRIPQDNERATACKQFDRDSGRIDWTKSTKELYNQYRGLHPWPGVWTTINEKRVKLIRISPTSEHIADQPGTMVERDKRLFIATQDGALEVLEIQPEGKPVMSQTAYMQGNAIEGTICT